MDNHLVIGLGGTGGNVIRELRKTIHRRNNNQVNPSWVNIEYLYVDSSPKELENQTDWKSLGQSVELNQHSKLPIYGVDLPRLIEEVDKHPGLKGWIGDRDIWLPYLRNSHGANAAGGQRRRLGRVLFASRVGAFNSSVADLVNSLEGGANGRAGEEGVTFHIVCGLAGGTGSGSVVDVICQIRKRWPTQHYPIIVYALLPEENPIAAWATKFYHPNGFAALLELNALSAGRFSPHDVSSSRVERHDLRDRFNGCYLITNRTETGTVYDVRDMPGVMADFLFQKVVSVRGLDHWHDLPRWENGENADSSPESSRRTARSAAAGDQSVGERSRRFMTFGIKRIVIPEVEIREYLAYAFARMATLQLRANNWTDEFGYIENPRNVDFSWVTHKDTQNRWRLSTEHLLLSIPILESDQGAKWKTIEQDWESFISNSAEDVQNVTAEKRKLVLEELEKRCQTRFDNDFRKLGVVRFYQEKRTRLRNEAREIVSLIERELMQRWLGGELSLIEIAGGKVEEREIVGVLQELRNDLTARKEKVDRSIVSLNDAEAQQSAAVGANKNTWSQMGKLSEWMGKGPKLLQAQIEASRALYVTRTKIQAWNFAKALLTQIEEELSLLASEATRAATTLGNALGEFDKEIAQRCQDSPRLDFDKQVVKFYNPDNVRKVTDRLTKDWQTQQKQTAEVRRAILAHINAQAPTFTFFNRDIHEQALQDIFLTKSLEQSRIGHDALELSETECLLGMNIVDRIKALYRTPEQLRQLAKEVIPKASCFGRIDEAQRGDHQANPDPNSICKRIISILGPNFGDNNAAGEANSDPFINALKAALRGATQAGDITSTFVDTGNDFRHEICLVSLTNLLPTRCLGHTAILRDYYNQLLDRQGDHSTDRLFLHLEGDGTQYPSVYTRARSEIVFEARTALLLGAALDILVERTNNITGIKSITFDVVKDGVVEDRKELGATLMEIPAKIDYQDFEHLEDRVRKELALLVHQGQKLKVKEKMMEEIGKVKTLCKDEPSHPDYKAFVVAYQRALLQLGIQA
jgi:uncharacterized SAM-dependent methyltransferase